MLESPSWPMGSQMDAHADPAPTLPAAWSGSDNIFTTGRPLDKSGKDISTPKILPAPFFRAAAELSGADDSKALEMINKMNKTELLRPADICLGPRRNSSVKLLNYHWWSVLTAQRCCRTRETGVNKSVTDFQEELQRGEGNHRPRGQTPLVGWARGEQQHHSGCNGEGLTRLLQGKALGDPLHSQPRGGGCSCPPGFAKATR